MAEETITVLCRVSPNARQSQFTGWTADEKGRPVLLIKLHAPPVEGKANAELIDFLADSLGCTKSAITLVRGQTSKLKVIELPASAAALLPKAE
jgi:uncharacterized protein